MAVSLSSMTISNDVNGKPYQSPRIFNPNSVRINTIGSKFTLVKEPATSTEPILVEIADDSSFMQQTIKYENSSVSRSEASSVTDLHVIVEAEPHENSSPVKLRGSGQSVSSVKLKCHYCKKFFNQKEKLKLHILTTHAKDNPYMCTKEGCDGEFSSSTALRNHIKTHTVDPAKQFPCESCGQGFSSKQALKEHEARHTGQKLYSCPQCNREFRQYSVMSRHMMRHNNEANFECAICGQRFKMNVYLQSHMKKHTGERPHECEICNKSFAHRSDLNRHRITHSNEKPFKCSLCDMRFNDCSSRRRHESVHNKPKQHACAYCGATFKLGVHLKAHIARKHIIGGDNLPTDGTAEKKLIKTDPAVITTNEFQCCHCGDNFKAIAHFNQHITQKHSSVVNNSISVEPVAMNDMPQLSIKQASVVTKSLINKSSPDVPLENAVTTSMNANIDETIVITNVDSSLEQNAVSLVSFETVDPVFTELLDQSQSVSPSNNEHPSQANTPNINLDGELILEEISDIMQYDEESERNSEHKTVKNDPQEIADGEFAFKTEPNVASLVQRVCLPKVNGNTVGLNVESLLSLVRDKIDPLERPVTVVYTLVEDMETQRIVDVHFLNVKLKEEKNQEDNFTISSVKSEETVIELQNRGASIDQNDVPFEMDISESMQCEFVDDSSQSNSLNNVISFWDDELTQRYLTNPDLTNEDFLNWLPSFATACKDASIPLTQNQFKSIYQIKCALLENMGQPSGFLASRDQYKLLIDVYKDLCDVITQHLSSVLSNLTD